MYVCNIIFQINCDIPCWFDTRESDIGVMLIRYVIE